MAYKVRLIIYNLFFHKFTYSFFQYLIFATLIAAVRAGLIAQPFALPPPLAFSSPIAKIGPQLAFAAKVATPIEEYDSNPQYKFAYDVQDSITGDSKSQHEIRTGDLVQGSYSVVDPDGTKRTVEYTADPVNGFNAVVSREPVGTPVAFAAPAATLAYSPKVVGPTAPIALGSPVAKFF